MLDDMGDNDTIKMSREALGYKFAFPVKLNTKGAQYLINSMVRP